MFFRFLLIIAIVAFIVWIVTSKEEKDQGASKGSILLTGLWWLFCWTIPLIAIGFMDYHLLDNLLITEIVIALIHFSFGTIYIFIHWGRMIQDASNKIDANRDKLEKAYASRPKESQKLSWDEWLAETGHIPQLKNSRRELAGRGLLWIYYLLGWCFSKVWFIISHTGLALHSVYDKFIIKGIGSLLQKQKDRILQKSKAKK